VCTPDRKRSTLVKIAGLMQHLGDKCKGYDHIFSFHFNNYFSSFSSRILLLSLRKTCRIVACSSQRLEQRVKARGSVPVINVSIMKKFVIADKHGLQFFKKF